MKRRVDSKATGNTTLATPELVPKASAGSQSLRVSLKWQKTPFPATQWTQKANRKKMGKGGAGEGREKLIFKCTP